MKKFGDVIAIENINLSIEKGECFSMLGPSGCGKTTTLRMIAGFEEATEEKLKSVINYCHRRKTISISRLRNAISDYDIQAFAVWPHMTVYDNVAFPLKLKNISAQEIEKRTTDALKTH